MPKRLVNSNLWNFSHFDREYLQCPLHWISINCSDFLLRWLFPSLFITKMWPTCKFQHCDFPQEVRAQQIKIPPSSCNFYYNNYWSPTVFTFAIGMLESRLEGLLVPSVWSCWSVGTKAGKWRVERWRGDTEDTQHSDMTPGGKPHRGIIVAGWGESKPPPSSPSPAPCQHLGKWSGEYCMTQTELDTFNMSFTKQTLSRGRRRPVLVSRARSDPWRPAGVSHRSTAQVSFTEFVRILCESWWIVRWTGSPSVLCVSMMTSVRRSWRWGGRWRERWSSSSPDLVRHTGNTPPTTGLRTTW